MAVLVLGHQIVHAALGLGELHLVNALAGVPVEKTFRRNMAVNCSEMRLKSSWMEVLLLMKVADMCVAGGPMLRKRT